MVGNKAGADSYPRKDTAGKIAPSPAVPAPFDFWGNPYKYVPRSRTQRAALTVLYAWEEAGEALMRAPGPVEAMIQDKVQQARALLWEVRDHLEELDREFCDKCGGKWIEDPVHLAYCCTNKYDHDERDHIRDALNTGSVYGPTPAPQGGTDGT